MTRWRVAVAFASVVFVAGSCIPDPTLPSNQAPVVQIAATPTSGAGPLTVGFSSAGTVDPDGSIAAYAWAFGDGGSDNAANPTHVYTAVGVHTATLVVTDNGGKTATASVTITVTGPVTTISPGSGPAGSSITVTVPCEPIVGETPTATAMAALVSDPGGTVVATGSFDNGATGVPNAVIVLAVPGGTTPGSYEVTSSCDTYMASTSYPPVPFTVT